MTKPLDRFGEIVASSFYDEALDHHDRLAIGQWKAPSLQKLQRDLACLSPEHR